MKVLPETQLTYTLFPLTEKRLVKVKQIIKKQVPVEVEDEEALAPCFEDIDEEIEVEEIKEVEKVGVIDVADTVLAEIGITKKFDIEKGVVVQMTADEILQAKQKDVEAKEAQNKAKRMTFLDAYRKYQAAVNYGEFERSSEVDVFIQKLRNKDWSAYDNVPSQLKYFTGEVGFDNSGLVIKS